VRGQTERAGTNSADFRSHLVRRKAITEVDEFLNTKVLTKLGVGNDLRLNVKINFKPQGGMSKQKIEEIKSALRELGLDDNVTD
jgi:hypothetical protein